MAGPHFANPKTLARPQRLSLAKFRGGFSRVAVVRKAYSVPSAPSRVTGSTLPSRSTIARAAIKRHYLPRHFYIMEYPVVISAAEDRPILLFRKSFGADQYRQLSHVHGMNWGLTTRRNWACPASHLIVVFEPQVVVCQSMNVGLGKRAPLLLAPVMPYQSLGATRTSSIACLISVPARVCRPAAPNAS